MVRKTSRQPGLLSGPMCTTDWITFPRTLIPCGRARCGRVGPGWRTPVRAASDGGGFGELSRAAANRDLFTVTDAAGRANTSRSIWGTSAALGLRQVWSDVPRRGLRGPRKSAARSGLRAAGLRSGRRVRDTRPGARAVQLPQACVAGLQLALPRLRRRGAIHSRKIPPGRPPLFVARVSPVGAPVSGVRRCALPAHHLEQGAQLRAGASRAGAAAR